MSHGRAADHAAICKSEGSRILTQEGKEGKEDEMRGVRESWLGNGREIRLMPLGVDYTTTYIHMQGFMYKRNNQTSGKYK